MNHHDDARLGRLAAQLVKLDPSCLYALERLLEQLPKASAPQDELKKRLLRHYAERDPQTFYQLDAFTEVEGDAVLTPDDEGHCVMSGVTEELMTGAYAVRVLITSGTTKDEAIRLLKKVLETIRADGLPWLEREAPPPPPFDRELPAEFWESPRLPDLDPARKPDTRFEVLMGEDHLRTVHDEEPF